MDLILQHCHHNRIWSLKVDVSTAPFRNTSIDRALSVDVLREILDYMVTQSRAFRDKETYLIYTQTLREWAELIYQWVVDNGRTNTVCTRYEMLHEKDVAFTELNETIFDQAIDLLVKDGKATVFAVSEGHTGIKF